MTTKKDTAVTPTNTADAGNETKKETSFLDGFMKTNSGKKKDADPKTYIMYKLSADRDAYNLVRALRSKGVDVEKLVFALLKKAINPEEDEETETADKPEEK